MKITLEPLDTEELAIEKLEQHETENKRRIAYLIEKEKVCGLDKAERLELLTMEEYTED